MNVTRILGQVAAVAAIVALAYIVLELGSGGDVGSERLVGRAAPPFAAPLAGSGLQGDANVYTRTAARDAGATAACDVRLRGAFVSCRDLARRAMIVFWTPTSERCVRQVSIADGIVRGLRPALRASAGGPSAAVGVALRPNPVTVEALQRDLGWRMPQAIDRDGAVGVLYAIGACPTTVFVRDGKVTAVRIGLLDRAELEREFLAEGSS